MAWRRHQLVWLAAPAWQPVLQAYRHDRDASACLRHWVARDLPLVATRQREPNPVTLALGLPSPACWGRRRLALEADAVDVRRIGAFPRAEAITPQLPVVARSTWEAFCQQLADMQVEARVYGSHGWQTLTALHYLHPASDIDLLMSVASPEQADAATASLLRFAESPLPRLDGELAFADGSAVAWREWAAWRGRRQRSLLVKRIDGAHLEAGSRCSQAG
jgi:phosphoribosyl-dephospho-CoA transferase